MKMRALTSSAQVFPILLSEQPIYGSSRLGVRLGSGLEVRRINYPTTGGPVVVPIFDAADPFGGAGLYKDWQSTLSLTLTPVAAKIQIIKSFPGIGVGVKSASANTYSLVLNVDKSKYPGVLEYRIDNGASMLLNQYANIVTAPASGQGSFNLQLRYKSSAFEGNSVRLANNKQYELTDHLGNVRAVVGSSLKKVGSAVQPTLIASNEYYPFGMSISSLSTNSEKYRYGFNGMEKDDEIKGNGKSYDFGARIYDPRICRFLSIDTKFKVYPWQSTYAFIRSNPIFFMDINGEGDPLVDMKVRTNKGSNLFGKVRAKDGVINNKNHQGFDYYAPEGTPIYAISTAEVYSIVNTTTTDYGKQIVLAITNSDGVVSYAFYAHLSEIDVEKGDILCEGDVIGKTGNTGNASSMKGDDQHLHFELRTTPSPGLGLGGRLNPNDIINTKFYSQDPDANTSQTSVGVVKVDALDCATKQNQDGTESSLDQYVPGSNVTELPAQGRTEGATE